MDTHSDVCRVAVKFYTKDGNRDLVGNKYPGLLYPGCHQFFCLIHAVKVEPDRGFTLGDSILKHPGFNNVNNAAGGSIG